MEEKEKLFGKLFETIPLYDEGHLETILNTMDKDNSTYFLIQAVKYGYNNNLYSLGECEVISKAIRTITKKETE